MPQVATAPPFMGFPGGGEGGTSLPFARPVGAWRSLVARLFWVQEVVGSSPAAPMPATPKIP